MAKLQGTKPVSRHAPIRLRDIGSQPSVLRRLAPQFALAVSLGALTAAMTPSRTSDVALAGIDPRFSTTEFNTPVDDAGTQKLRERMIAYYTPATPAKIDLPEIHAPTVILGTPILPASSVVTPMPEIKDTFAQCVTPLRTPMPGGDMDEKLRLSAPVMKKLGLKADSILAWHKNCPITVRGYLADRDAGRLPEPEYIPQFIAALAKNGFNRLPIQHANKDVALTIRRESSGWPVAVSRAGAMGLTQFMPGTIEDYPHNPFDPAQSAQASGEYISWLKKRYGNYWPIAYNSGLVRINASMAKNNGHVDMCDMPKETQSYVRIKCKSEPSFWSRIFKNHTVAKSDVIPQQRRKHTRQHRPKV